MFSKLCKWFSIGVFVLAFFGSFYLAETISIKSNDSEAYTVMLMTMLSAGVLCMIIYGIGEIAGSSRALIEQNAEILDNQEKLLKHLINNKNTPGV